MRNKTSANDYPSTRNSWLSGCGCFSFLTFCVSGVTRNRSPKKYPGFIRLINEANLGNGAIVPSSILVPPALKEAREYFKEDPEIIDRYIKEGSRMREIMEEMLAHETDNAYSIGFLSNYVRFFPANWHITTRLFQRRRKRRRHKPSSRPLKRDLRPARDEFIRSMKPSLLLLLRTTTNCRPGVTAPSLLNILILCTPRRFIPA